MIQFFCRSFAGAHPQRTRWATRVLAVLLLAFGASSGGLLTAPGAQALEALDGRVQAHGFVEMQLRTISKNYTGNWDLVQWYNIFNLELEVDLLQDTIGPLDLVSGYVRVEARFDCIYSRGCGMVKPVNTFGNRARSLPTRLMDGDTFTTAGQITLTDDGPIARPDRNPLAFQEVPGFEGLYGEEPEDQIGPGALLRPELMQCTTSDCSPANAVWRPWNAPTRFWKADRNQKWASTSGQPWETIDDGTQGSPFLVNNYAFEDFRFATIPVIGGAQTGHAQQIFGPWLPENFVEPNAAMADIANPLDQSRVSPASLSFGAGGSPYRPIPIYREDNPERSQIYIRDLRPFTDPNPERDANGDPLDDKFNDYDDTFGWQVVNPNALDRRTFNDRAAAANEARGIFVPSAPLRAALAEGNLDTYNFNFTQQQRAFNRGAAQQDEGELKEAYLDIEMFDSRLWMRVGKQTIVWGKTELFRTTDQFNPQDLALANLPSLEESRIALWAWRGVWSFYEVGPLSDVRAELAFNFDEFESADLGACGEPFTINIVCQLTFGAMAHGFTGIGVVGQEQPPNPWDSLKGWEIGGRLEFRWDRFSFAITDFYGYDDFPHVRRLSTYNRNVDWRTGRPRVYMHSEQDLQLSFDGTVGRGCATPTDPGIPTTGGVIDNSASATPGYVEYDGAENAGCLTPGSSNRMVDSAGKPYQVPFGTPDSRDNPWGKYSTQFWNDTSRADANDPRPDCFEGTGGSNNVSPDCLALADYDPRYDPNNTLANNYGTSQGRLDARFISDLNPAWLNSYDPTLRYDPRNALEQSPTNLSVFNWVCASTVGFSELDPSACATTVFSSQRYSRGVQNPVSYLLAGVISGSQNINVALSGASANESLSYFTSIPQLMGIPFMRLHVDTIAEVDDEATPNLNEALFTYDRRAQWAVETGVAGAAADLDQMLIRAREGESYNCLSRGFTQASALTGQAVLCGGYAWRGTGVDTRSQVVGHISRGFAPEQEALLGCGPYFGTSCDANGVDLLWAEGSALLQSAIGNDSIGIAFSDLGIQDLVPEIYGDRLMDNGSIPLEYRTDGRVIGVDGQLIRINETTGLPELGTAEGAATGFVGRNGQAIGHDGNDCNLTYEPFNVDPTTQEQRLRTAAANRFNSRCWDRREYFVVNGIQPGTSAFEIQGLGGPKCTTADIGGPQGASGILPGCRNKWATIRYNRVLQPGEGEYHPNNPLAEYVGNNYLGTVGDPTGQRTDYQQIDLAAQFGWCPASDPDCNVNAPDGRLVTLTGGQVDPTGRATTGSGLNWGVYSPGQVPGCDVAGSEDDPRCYLAGWVQTTDGDPDRLGVLFPDEGAIDFPQVFQATGGFDFGTGPEDLGTWVTNIVQRDYVNIRAGTPFGADPSGCTEMQAWVWMQRVADEHGGGYINHAECTSVKTGIGAGHPFTGESWSSEVAGLSFNFMMLLVAFSPEFADGIASVRGFVDPATYDAKLYSDQPLTSDDANFDRRDSVAESGIDDQLLPCPVTETNCSRLQRDPDLPNVLDVFPDLKWYEQQSPWAFRENAARRLRLGTSAGQNIDAIGAGAAEIARGSDGKIFSQGENGGRHRWRGLIHTMLWDYAFTGSENQLMALIPKCTDERATQARMIQGSVKFVNPSRIDCREGSAGETLGSERCTFVTPQHCSLVQALYSVAGQKRNIMRAGGNGTFGRRTMQWQSGSEVYLSYEKRNVLGFSMDFAEDFTKSNWSTEFTFIKGIPTADANSYELNTRTDTYNLTVSVDRPTFVNFLNSNRTIFINSQWFFQYRSNYNSGMGPNGPWNTLATLSAFTGYFQDRLNPAITGVYDFRSRSGAALPSINYRFSEAFSITVGASIFFGRQQLQPMQVNPIGPAIERGGVTPYQDGFFGGLSLIKDRDEVYMTLRYTF